MLIQVKRVYLPSSPEDGWRVLVDRLWPRGLARATAALDEWIPQCAPSNELRRWFAHDRTKWAGFKRRDFAELAAEDLRAVIEMLRDKAQRGRVTLLFSASEVECNNAVALAEYLSKPAGRSRGGPRPSSCTASRNIPASMCSCKP